MKLIMTGLILSVGVLSQTVAMAEIRQIKCTESESHESRTTREYNGDDADGVLKNAKPNDITGNIGDYTINIDTKTNKILSIHIVRKTSNVKKVFDGKTAIITNKLVNLQSGSFDGECTDCRTHFELIEGKDGTGNRISIKIDDHGVYPGFAASNIAFKIGSAAWTTSEQWSTEVSCDSTVVLQRPAASESLEDDLIE